MKCKELPLLAASTAGLAAVAILVAAHPALAYVGPGAGITMLGALWAVIAALVLAVVGVVAWPLRAMVRKKRAAKEAATAPRDAARESAQTGSSGS